MGRGGIRVPRFAGAFLAFLIVGSGLLAAFGYFAAPSSACPAVLFAAPAGVGADNCNDSADACSLPTALSAGCSGVTVDLAAGTYAPGAGTSFTVATNTHLQPAVTGSTVTLSGNGDTVVTINGGVTATINGVTVTGGSTSSFGLFAGGIDNSGTLTISDSTISGNTNTADGPGGIANGDTLTILDSTVSGNSATGSCVGCGGIFDNGTLTVEESTISGNTEGGLFSNDTPTIAASIIAHQASGPDCAGAFGPPLVTTDSGYNIDDDGTCEFHVASSVSDSTVIDDYLGTLGSNGGPTQTVPLLSSPSPFTATADPALGVVPGTFDLPTGPAACSVADQRGTTRPSPCDIGAFERSRAQVVVPTSTSTSLSISPNPAGVGQSVTMTATVSGAGGSPGGAVTFYDGTTSLGLALLSGDSATFSTSTLSTGTHSITANYSGYGNISSSIGGPVSLSVSSSTTTTTVAPTTTTTAPPTSTTTTSTPTSTTTTVLPIAPGTPKSPGYIIVTSNGSVLAFGSVTNFGSVSSNGFSTSGPIVGSSIMPNSLGYWLVSSGGGVYTFGSAGFFGSAAGLDLVQPIVGISSTPDGKGYWLVAADGGVFTFGDADFFGSMAGTSLDAPVVGMVPTPDGMGYWLVAADGGVFTFGDARFQGDGVSSAAQTSGVPAVGIAADASGGGYWIAYSNGTVSTFGNAESIWIPVRSNALIVGIQATSDGGGYWLFGADGGVFTFGDAAFFGSATGSTEGEAVS